MTCDLKEVSEDVGSDLDHEMPVLLPRTDVLTEDYVKVL